MSDVVVGLGHMEKCLPGGSVDGFAALKNTPSQLLHLQLHGLLIQATISSFLVIVFSILIFYMSYRSESFWLGE